MTWRVHHTKRARSIARLSHRSTHLSHSQLALNDAIRSGSNAFGVQVSQASPIPPRSSPQNVLLLVSIFNSSTEYVRSSLPTNNELFDRSMGTVPRYSLIPRCFWLAATWVQKGELALVPFWVKRRYIEGGGLSRERSRLLYGNGCQLTSKMGRKG